MKCLTLMISFRTGPLSLTHPQNYHHYVSKSHLDHGKLLFANLQMQSAGNIRNHNFFHFCIWEGNVYSKSNSTRLLRRFPVCRAEMINREFQTDGITSKGYFQLVAHLGGTLHKFSTILNHYSMKNVRWIRSSRWISKKWINSVQMRKNNSLVVSVSVLNSITTKIMTNSKI